MKVFVTLAVLIVAVTAQRPFYAGRRPSASTGLADRFNAPENSTAAPAIGDRFGENGELITTTTVRLPVDALGDKDLVDRISKWPVDQQPFWYINWRQIEANRERPQSIGQPNTRPTFLRPIGSQDAVRNDGFAAGNEQPPNNNNIQRPSGNNQRPTDNNQRIPTDNQRPAGNQEPLENNSRPSSNERNSVDLGQRFGGTEQRQQTDQRSSDWRRPSGYERRQQRSWRDWDNRRGREWGNYDQRDYRRQ